MITLPRVIVGGGPIGPPLSYRPGCGPAGDSEFWHDIWAATADAISEHVKAGRAHLLTEDTLRFPTIRSLEAVGVPAADMEDRVADA